ncbi:hypothetical protein [Oryza sativa Japonica Group]|uniref:Uncharacterized protein n=1 Tax=Oryza sativa subsp. japonica TaxID=39947 RepID=Q5N6Z1_ORYSJ|nr:hypothetical protein [Oryza sativa Japonica Group]BAD82765.1 hypothetical protein [Oryza sativa Japonica Group]
MAMPAGADRVAPAWWAPLASLVSARAGPHPSVASTYGRERCCVRSLQATDSRVAGDDKPGQPPTRSGAAQLLVRVRACTPPAAGRPVGPPPPQLVAPSDCHVGVLHVLLINT